MLLNFGGESIVIRTELTAGESDLGSVGVLCARWSGLDTFSDELCCDVDEDFNVSVFATLGTFLVTRCGVDGDSAWCEVGGVTITLGLVEFCVGEESASFELVRLNLIGEGVSSLPWTATGVDVELGGELPTILDFPRTCATGVRSFEASPVGC